MITFNFISVTKSQKSGQELLEKITDCFLVYLENDETVDILIMWMKFDKRNENASRI